MGNEEGEKKINHQQTEDGYRREECEWQATV